MSSPIGRTVHAAVASNDGGLGATGSRLGLWTARGHRRGGRAGVTASDSQRPDGTWPYVEIGARRWPDSMSSSVVYPRTTRRLRQPPPGSPGQPVHDPVYSLALSILFLTGWITPPTPP